MSQLNQSKPMRGQVLSYDALGAVVIFIIAVGILVTYWSSLSASFDDSDPLLVLQANTALDNLMNKKALLEPDGYHINVTKFRKCEFNSQEAGIYSEYYLQVIDGEGNAKEVSDAAGGLASGCGVEPKNARKIATAERLAYYNETGSRDVPVRVILKVYVK